MSDPHPRPPRPSQWAAEVDASRLPQSAKRLARFITTRKRVSPGVYRLNSDMAAAALGLSPQSIAFAKKRLVEFGWLGVEKQGRQHVGATIVALKSGSSFWTLRTESQDQDGGMLTSGGQDLVSGPARCKRDDLPGSSSPQAAPFAGSWTHATALAALREAAPQGADPQAVFDEITAAADSPVGYVRSIYKSGDLPTKITAALRIIETRNDEEARSERANAARCPHGVINGTQPLADETCLCPDCDDVQEATA